MVNVYDPVLKVDVLKRQTTEFGYPHPRMEKDIDHFVIFAVYHIAMHYDNYRELLDTLIERIPDFNMRLKVNPKTSRIEFSADVNSVFAIAWFTLAKMISEDPAPKNKVQPDNRPEGIMICCRHRGDFLIKKE